MHSKVGLPWPSRGWDSALPLQGARVRSLAGELRSRILHATRCGPKIFFNLKKICILAKLMYRFNAIPTKSAMTFSIETEQTILRCVWDHKGPRRAKATLRKENGLEASRSLTSHYITKLQSQKSVESAQKQARRPEEQSREPRNQPTGM